MAVTYSKYFNGTTDKNTMFAGYIKSFLKLKLQASGFPVNVVTMEQKLAYIESMRVKHDIILDIDKIIRNDALREVAKLFLNR